jgi:hypothetical protein
MAMKKKTVLIPRVNVPSMSINAHRKKYFLVELLGIKSCADTKIRKQ